MTSNDKWLIAAVVGMTLICMTIFSALVAMPLPHSRVFNVLALWGTVLTFVTIPSGVTLIIYLVEKHNK